MDIKDIKPDKKYVCTVEYCPNLDETGCMRCTTNGIALLDKMEYDLPNMFGR